MTDRDTSRWRGVTALTFVAGALGVALQEPFALLVGVVGVAFAAYASAATVPSVDLRVERTVSDPRPDPGDEVTVTVTVTSEGGWLPDLRLVDGVPDALAVVDGSPRLGTALRPGRRAAFSYTVRAQRGRHTFDPLHVVARGFSGASEREERVEAAADADPDIVCAPPLVTALDGVPLRRQTIQHTGHVTTDVGGSGLEFHTTREYRPGDSLTRIDWKRRAKTGEFTTIQFREEQAAVVVLLVDTRDEAYVRYDDASAVEYGVQGAGEVAAALLGEGDSVGLASFGPHWTWVAPGLGRDHRLTLRDTLALDPGFAPTPPDRQFLSALTVRRLRKSLPGDAQVFVFSPVLDDDIADAVRRLEAYGHAVTLVSPDVVTGSSAGATVARLERAARLRSLRRAGVRTVDWNPDRPLAAALADAERGWRR